MAQSSSWRRTRYIYIYSIYIYKILGFYPRLTLERRQPTFLFLGIGTSKSSARCDQHDDAARQKRHVGNRKRQWLQFRREIRRRRDGRLSHGFVFFFFPYLVSRRQNYRRLHCKALWLEIRKRSGPVFIDPKRGPYRELDTTIVLQRGPILTRAPKPNFLFSPLFIFITFYKNTEQKKKHLLQLDFFAIRHNFLWVHRTRSFLKPRRPRPRRYNLYIELWIVSAWARASNQTHRRVHSTFRVHYIRFFSLNKRSASSETGQKTNDESDGEFEVSNGECVPQRMRRLAKSHQIPPISS